MFIQVHSLKELISKKLREDDEEIKDIKDVKYGLVTSYKIADKLKLIAMPECRNNFLYVVHDGEILETIEFKDEK